MALKYLSLVILALGLVSCSGTIDMPSDSALTPPPESFVEADRPSLEKDADAEFRLLKPWNYYKEWNTDRKYPLVVSLHGGGGSCYTPCIVGNDEEMQKYPCFFMAPHNRGWGANAAWVRDEIEALIRTYRIDTNRIYLMGFSMGGSGSYPFANLAYDEHKRLFAGIVRLAGQSQTILNEPIPAKTSVWYHIGLEDASSRVRIAEEAYQAIKARPENASAVETTSSDTVDGHARFTKTLTKDGVVIMRKSEYTGVGHSPSVPFKDPAVLQWLFGQSLENR